MKLTRQQIADYFDGERLAKVLGPDEAEKKGTGIYYMKADDVWETIKKSPGVTQEMKNQLVAFFKEKILWEGEDRCDVLQFGIVMGEFSLNLSEEEWIAWRKLAFEFHDTKKYKFEDDLEG